MSKTAASFILVIFLTFAWRCVGITFDSLWLDEGYQSIVDAYGRPLPSFLQVPAQPFIFNPGPPASPSDMLANFRKVDPLTPPLYQLLLNRWIAAFGGADLTLRLLSVLISTGCAAAVFFVSNRLFGLRCALLVGLVQAFSPFDIYYGQEVRMYGLVALSATLSFGTMILLLLHYLRGRERIAGWLVYAVSTWALINSHYTGLFVVVLEGMVGLAAAIARRSFRLLGLLCAAWLLVVVLWLPWLGMFFEAAAKRTESFYVAREPSLWWPFYALFVKIPLNWIVMLAGKHVVLYAIPLYLTSAVALLLGLRALVRLERRQRIAAALCVLWMVVPAVVLWVLDVKENHKVVEISRYVMATAPAVYIMAGLGLSKLRWRSRLAVVLLGAHFIFASVNNIAHATVNHQREAWHLLAAKLEATAPAEELVLVAQHYNIICLDRYLHRPYRQVGVDSGTAPERVAAILTPLQAFTLITAQEGEAFKVKVPPQFSLVEESHFAHGLHLRRYERP